MSPEVRDLVVQLGAKARAFGIIPAPVLEVLDDSLLGQLQVGAIVCAVNSGTDIGQFLKEMAAFGETLLVAVPVAENSDEAPQAAAV